MTLRHRLGAIASLGPRSLLDVGIYRLGLKLGVHPVLRLKAVDVPAGEFFATSTVPGPAEPTSVFRESLWAFAEAKSAGLAAPPDWHVSCQTSEPLSNMSKQWHQAGAFRGGDVKTVWELSRWDWTAAFAQHLRAGDAGAGDRLNAWLASWHAANPPYRGVNWQCAQEASIRVLHLALTARLLGQLDTPSPPVLATLVNHLRRIAPTTAYARGQDNNHATSEAAALTIGGWWLTRMHSHPDIRQEAAQYVEQGRALLEERVAALVFEDGGFSQYSVVYHRLMLDTLSLAELLRRDFAQERFSATFNQRARAAAEWLIALIEGNDGDAPNLGSNDGAWLVQLGSGGFRDFRPSAALASTLFTGSTPFADQPSVQSSLGWLNLEAKPAVRVARPPVRALPDSALVILSRPPITAFLRLPGTRFRPPQADALHLDLWADGKGLLIDAGTYSYADEGWDYFPSTAAHNTIEFDGRDQMPRVGRFLFGRWLRREFLRCGEGAVSSEYRDYRGCSHQRSIAFNREGAMVVRDTLDGSFQTACLRWHFEETEAGLADNTCRTTRLSVTVTGDRPPELTLAQAPRSLRYQSKELRPVMAARFPAGTTTIETRIELR